MDPKNLEYIVQSTLNVGFRMSSEKEVGSLLRVLAALKPKSKMLELGTGTGISTSWILDGMDQDSSLISIDNDPLVLDVAARYLQNDKRLTLVCCDGGEWLKANSELKFDFIFADSWHGKYLMLSETLAMLNSGGIYLIDDLNVQENWPDGHADKANELKVELLKRKDLKLSYLNFASGLMIGAKI